MRRIAAVVLAGDARVWRAAGVVALPLVALLAFHCLHPRPYFTGTNSVDAGTFFGEAPAGASICTPAILEVPGETAIVRLRLRSPTRTRPPLRLTLLVGKTTVRSALPARRVPPDRISNADFAIPETPTQPEGRIASLCASAAQAGVEWAGARVQAASPQTTILNGVPQAAQLGVWYLPRAGATRSYVQEAWTICKRAAMFRPGFVGAWTYLLVFVLLLPGLALAAVRCLAQAVAGGRTARRMGASLFAVAALNFVCWALITPAFQAPDEVDHFAYTQSLAERGETPNPDPSVPLDRWSSAESLALAAIAFRTDHEVADTRMPGTAAAEVRYRDAYAAQHPPANDDGGYSPAATHGPLYYLALSPAYLLAKDATTFSQLTLMRFTSALVAALAALFAFLLARELAPNRPWLGVLAGLMVAYEPMYGFISGSVNNDVGVNAAAAAVAFLLVRLLRRGLTIPWGLSTGVVLVATPLVKGTGMSLYPVAALAIVAALWLHHSRGDLFGWLSLVAGAIAMNEISAHVLSKLRPSSAATGFQAIGSNGSAARDALHHIPDFLSYLWQIFLPALPFMSQHFAIIGNPAYRIFVRRGWGAFGWYDVFFPTWIYALIAVAMLGAIPLGVWAARREWGWIRRNWPAVATVILIPIAVVAGFEAAYYSPGVQTILPTYGRYAFPAMAPLAVIVVGALHAFGRRNMFYPGVALLVAMIALSYSGQLLTLTSFYG